MDETVFEGAGTAPRPAERPLDVAGAGIRLWSHAMHGASAVLDRAARSLGHLAAAGHEPGDA